MNLPSRLLLLSLLAVCGSVSAQVFGDAPLHIETAKGNGGPSGYIDGFFVLDNRLTSDDNDTRIRLVETDKIRGGGAEGRLDVVPGLFLTGEYRRTPFNRAQQTDLNTAGMAAIGISSDLTTIRGGAGVGAVAGGVPVYIRGEYSSLNLTGDDRTGRKDGYGVLAGVSGSLNRFFGVEGEAGYQDNRSFGRGFEYRVGGWLNVLPNLALTLNYRRTRLDHSDVLGSGYLETGAAGIRFQFGGTGLPAPAPASMQP